MMGDVLAHLAFGMSIEDRVMFLVEVLGNSFEHNDIEILLPMMEARYRLMPDEKKQGYSTLLKFVREMNTLRPAAMELVRVANEAQARSKNDDHR